MIVGIGCIAHDLVLYTETTWSEGKGRIARREVRFGGNARTALTAAAALGAHAAYLATVSPDPEWNDVIVDLDEHDVDRSYLEYASGAHPVSSTVIITSDGERYIAFDDSSLATTPLPSVTTVDGAFANARVLLVDAATAPPGSLALLHRARESGIPIVLDAEREVPGSPIVHEMVDVADHLVLPLQFARHLTGSAAPVDVVQALWSPARAAVVITDGTHGAYLRTPTSSTVEQIPAYRVPVHDTNGCGDVFHGAYAVGLLTEQSAVDRVRRASAAAAVVAALPSGVRRVPSLEAVAALMGAGDDERP